MKCHKIGILLSNLCLNSVAVYTVAALSPKRAFVAEACLGQGQPVVQDLMIEYNGPIIIFSYFRSKYVNKLLVW